MFEFRDIYFKVGINLAKNNFDFRTTGVQKEQVDKYLKVYLIDKLNEINSSQINNSNNEITVETLVDELGDLIPQERHFDTIRHLTHFILNIAGEMQSWSIVWYSENNPEFIDNALVKFKYDGKWESLTTHNDESYVKTFKQVYGIFKEKFMVKEKIPQLVIARRQLLEDK